MRPLLCRGVGKSATSSPLDFPIAPVDWIVCGGESGPCARPMDRASCLGNFRPVLPCACPTPRIMLIATPDGSSQHVERGRDRTGKGDAAS